ncbi:MAG TPA: ribosome-associated translation inhibitor RaiA, partial [Petrotogaceae bacterium]|nr:ribosome-associated translation inhibitor RaiA [Petrotogaceae bacterium]
MDYKVLARDFQLTPAIEEYLEKRMAKPDRLLRVHGDLISVPDVKIEKEGGIYKVEITAHFKKINKIIKVEQRGGDLYEIIDNVTDSFERKINKMKTKLQEHFSDTVEYDIPPSKDAFVQDK